MRSGVSRHNQSDGPVRVIDIPGDGAEAGTAYGEACRDLIRAHLDVVQERLWGTDASRTASATAAAFRSAVAADLPALASEIDGIALGAGLKTHEAWMLQLRSELLELGGEQDDAAECTSFGVRADSSATGSTIAGQNGDLPPNYADLLVLIRRHPSRRPRYLTVTPAGQVAWHGMNEAGVAVFANFLRSAGWRVGIPRYLYTRLALEACSAAEAAERIRGTRHAASRNVLITDETEVLNLEVAVGRVAAIHASDGVLAHTNHFLAHPDWERSGPAYVADSRERLARMDTLLRARNAGIDIYDAIEMLRDRESRPFTISRLLDDTLDPSPFVTVVSTVADVGERRLWVAFGAPHLSRHHPYNV